MTSANDTISFWLNTAGKYPLLPKEEVDRLGHIIQAGQPGERKRDKAVEKLVLHNLRLIPGIVRRCVASKRTFRFGDNSTEDLLQCGVLGLRRAAEKFDPRLGYRFSTYASSWIFQAIHRDLLNNLSLMRVPETTIRELYQAIEKNNDYSFRHLKKDQIKRMNDAMSALTMASINTSTLPVDEQIDCKRFYRHANKLHCEDASDHVDEYSFLSFDQIVGSAKLTERQEKVLRMIYVDELNQRQVGKQLGISPCTVKETLKRAHNQLALAFDR